MYILKTTASFNSGSSVTKSYNDLIDKPQINNVELNGNKTTQELGLFSGNYDDLSNKPTIPTVPTNISAFTNDVGYITEQAISGKEDISNKVTSLSASSTDTQYPSAKCVYDMIGDVETILTTITTGGGVS